MALHILGNNYPGCNHLECRNFNFPVVRTIGLWMDMLYGYNSGYYQPTFFIPDKMEKTHNLDKNP